MHHCHVSKSSRLYNITWKYENRNNIYLQLHYCFGHWFCHVVTDYLSSVKFTAILKVLHKFLSFQKLQFFHAMTKWVVLPKVEKYVVPNRHGRSYPPLPLHALLRKQCLSLLRCTRMTTWSSSSTPSCTSAEQCSLIADQWPPHTLNDADLCNTLWYPWDNQKIFTWTYETVWDPCHSVVLCRTGERLLLI